MHLKKMHLRFNPPVWSETEGVDQDLAVDVGEYF